MDILKNTCLAKAVLLLAFAFANCSILTAQDSCTSAGDCGYFNCDSAATSCGFSGRGIGQDTVKQRIFRWGGLPKDSMEKGGELPYGRHYQDGDGQIAFNYQCGAIATLIKNVDTTTITDTIISNPGGDPDTTYKITKTPGKVRGIRAYYGLATTPSDTGDMSGIRIFLVPVDDTGQELYGDDTTKQVLGNYSGWKTVPSGGTCLGLKVAKTDVPGGPTNGFLSRQKLLAFTANFRNYLTPYCDPDTSTTCGDDSLKYHCPLSNCSGNGGYWYTSYTYCVEFFDLLLSQEGAAGIRFYFGLRTDGSGNYEQHASAMVAIDSDQIDICDQVEDAYVDWAQPCPTLCGGDGGAPGLWTE